MKINLLLVSLQRAEQIGISAIKVDGTVLIKPDAGHLLQVEIAEIGAINFVINLPDQIRADFCFLWCNLHVI